MRKCRLSISSLNNETHSLLFFASIFKIFSRFSHFLGFWKIVVLPYHSFDKSTHFRLKYKKYEKPSELFGNSIFAIILYFLHFPDFCDLQKFRRMSDNDNVYLFYPNLIGYGRIVLAIVSFYCMSTSPLMAMFWYSFKFYFSRLYHQFLTYRLLKPTMRKHGGLEISHLSCMRKSIYFLDKSMAFNNKESGHYLVAFVQTVYFTVKIEFFFSVTLCPRPLMHSTAGRREYTTRAVDLERCSTN